MSPDETQRNERIAKSYVWHAGRCFFVSTIERDSSAPQGGRYEETIAWTYDWDRQIRGHQIYLGEGPGLHWVICQELEKNGKIIEETDEA